VVKRLGIAVVALCSAGACTAVLDVPEVTLSHATCTDGACVCEAHFAHCVASSPDRCETDLLTTSAHCGACGHDCRGGECQNGACQPVVISSVEGARGLAAFGGEVYLGVCRDVDPDAGAAPGLSFLRLRFDGAGPEPAIYGPMCGELPLVVGKTLYWSGTHLIGQGALLSTAMPPASTTPAIKTVVDGTIAVSLAVTASSIYWRELAFTPPGTWTDTGLWMAPLASGPSAHLVTQSSAATASGDTVYWTSPEGSPLGVGLFQRSEATGTIVQLSTLPGLNLAADAGHLYMWVKEGTTAQPGGIYSLAIPVADPVAPPPPTLLVPDVKSMGAIFTDGKALTWIENVASEIKLLDLAAGGPPRVLVSKVGFGGVARLAADADTVYFIGDSVVGRVAR
jgi:hypothetical protein